MSLNSHLLLVTTNYCDFVAVYKLVLINLRSLILIKLWPHKKNWRRDIIRNSSDIFFKSAKNNLCAWEVVVVIVDIVVSPSSQKKYLLGLLINGFYWYLRQRTLTFCPPASW